MNSAGKQQRNNTALWHFVSPRYWPTWLGLGVVRLLGYLPHPLGLRLAGSMGGLLQRLMGRRAAIARRNLERAFPTLDQAQSEQMLDAHFCSLAMAPVEIAWAWFRSPDSIASFSTVKGLEHLREAQRRGRGVLMLTAHSTCLEMAARIICREEQVVPVYRPLSNPLLETYQNRQRLRHLDQVVSKYDLRGMVKALRAGKVVWYAQDQDFGPDRSGFAPFFGIETATLLATRKLAASTGAAVVPMMTTRDENYQYTTRFLPALEDFPSDDERRDLTAINQAMETLVSDAPAQYWWIHRRFKTRPEGEAGFYEGLGR